MLNRYKRLGMMIRTARAVGLGVFYVALTAALLYSVLAW